MMSSASLLILLTLLGSQQKPDGRLEITEEKVKIGALEIRAGTLVEMTAPARRRFLKERLQQWEGRYTGRVYYLREPVYPLLANDPVIVERAHFWDRTHLGLEGELLSIDYHCRLFLENEPPSPRHRFKLQFEDFGSLEDLERRLARILSDRPLESYFDWSTEVKAAVRARVVTLGMDQEMAILALGKLPYQSDIERLDDGRIRETWKILIKADTRTAFTARRAQFQSTGSTTSSSSGSAIRIGDSTFMGSTGTATSVASGIASGTGFAVFGGLPPEFLHIVFTDDKVTARKTEFVK